MYEDGHLGSGRYSVAAVSEAEYDSSRKRMHESIDTKEYESSIGEGHPFHSLVEEDNASVNQMISNDHRKPYFLNAAFNSAKLVCF